MKKSTVPSRMKVIGIKSHDCAIFMHTFYFCSGNTVYLFTASQLYTALCFPSFRHASFYKYSCKETRGNNTESCDATNTNVGYP